MSSRRPKDPVDVFLKEWQRAARRETNKIRREAERQRKKRIEVAQNTKEVQQHQTHVHRWVAVHNECSPKINWDALTSSFLSWPISFFTAVRVLNLGAGLFNWRFLSHMAYPIARGESVAFQKVFQWGALRAFKAFNPVSQLTFHRAKDHSLIEVKLGVEVQGLLPDSVKSLTRTGRVSEHQMSGGEFGGYVQDVFCSIALRATREAFALLPVEFAVVTIIWNYISSATGHPEQMAVVSLIASRVAVQSINYERIDPSNALSNFPNRMCFVRGTMCSIIPFDVNEVKQFINSHHFSF